MTWAVVSRVVEDENDNTWVSIMIVLIDSACVRKQGH